MNDPAKFAQEEGRLTSFNNILDKAGYEEFAYSDWVEETVALLRKCAASLPCTDEGAVLAASFNDDDIGPAIIQHFRVSKSPSPISL